MRHCYQCGGEFGIFRHIIFRGRFCSESCANSFHKDIIKMQEWFNRHHANDQTNVSTFHNDSKFKTLPNGVVKLQEGRADSPLYFFGPSLSVFRIAQLMGSGRAIFAVDASWPSAWRDAAVHNKTSALPTMEQLLEPDVAILRCHAGSSNQCALAGFSFGGVLAFEAAHQLCAQGVNVEMVMLLDAVAAYRPPHEVVWQNLQKDWARTMSQSIRSRLESLWSVIRWMFVKQVKRLGRCFLQIVFRDLDELTDRFDDTGVPLHWGLIERIYLHAVNSYQLRPLDCRGVLFRTDDERPARLLDGSLGWSKLFTRGLEIVDVPGTHMTAMLREPYNRILAQGMREVLDRHFTKPTRRICRRFHPNFVENLAKQE
jgi:thioesterase domain-containing protein